MAKRTKVSIDWGFLRFVLPWLPFGAGGSSLLRVLSGRFPLSALEFHLSDQAQGRHCGRESMLTLRGGGVGALVARHARGGSRTLSKLELLVGPSGCRFGGELRELVTSRKPMRLETDSMQVVGAFRELDALTFHLRFAQVPARGEVRCSSLELRLDYESPEAVRTVLRPLRAVTAVVLSVGGLCLGGKTTGEVSEALGSVFSWMQGSAVDLVSLRVRSRSSVSVALPRVLCVKSLTLEGRVELPSRAEVSELRVRGVGAEVLERAPERWPRDLSTLELLSGDLLSSLPFARYSRWVERMSAGTAVLGRFRTEEQVLHVLAVQSMVRPYGRLHLVCLSGACSERCAALARDLKRVHFVFI